MTANQGQWSKSDPDWPTVKCGLDGCDNRLRARNANGPDVDGDLGPQWCSREHREATEHSSPVVPEVPVTQPGTAEIRAVIQSGMWDGTWARQTILDLCDYIDTLEVKDRPAERPSDADDTRYQERNWEGTA